MVDAQILKSFEETIINLRAKKLDSITTRVIGKEIHRWINFGRKYQFGQSEHYYLSLEISYCAWQISHENLPIYNYSLNSEKSEEAGLQLEKLIGKIVDSVEFDKDNFSLLLQFKNNYALKLLSQKENDWRYALFVREAYRDETMGRGEVYDIQDEDIELGYFNF